MSRVAAIIPARMASTRFPGKPLANINGLPMIEHVRRRVTFSKRVDEIIVATCDKEIYDEVIKHGGNASMTSDTHERGTDRIAEVASKLSADIVVNVQGDEPMLQPSMIDRVIEPLLSDSTILCVNLIAPIKNKDEYKSPNLVKVVKDLNDFILYYSREPIPSTKKSNEDFNIYKQLGIISFKKDFLLKYTKLPPTPLEKIESVDMLRILEHEYRIKTVEVPDYSIYGVDTVEDLKLVERLLKNDPLCEEYM
ncbi:MAG: 3-deoxy-manno-octulosonate cytidylyltransferase [Promethearchaeota archaeon]|jgi:3-deoxy-manno-octulosonate cytidylyltransferase (CMP-KDO synthetase)